MALSPKEQVEIMFFRAKGLPVLESAPILTLPMSCAGRSAHACRPMPPRHEEPELPGLFVVCQSPAAARCIPVPLTVRMRCL
eukprot:361046-Chlamydomonas_euryale.AAC.4